MSVFTKLRKTLLGQPQSKVTRLPANHQAARIDELPPFNLHIADLMRFDPQVRIGLGARNGLLMSAEVVVSGPNPRATRWVQHQWNALWRRFAHQLLRTKHYGFLPFEVVYRQATSGPFAGLIEVDRLIDLHPRDARLLVQGDKIVGFTSTPRSARPPSPGGPQINAAPFPAARSHPAGEAYEDILAPQALVCTYDAECDNPYGCALLARAYPAWYEKWMPGGAKRTLQLRMLKDAYVGDIIWYPPNRSLSLPGGEQISFRDVARAIVEGRRTGGALTLPLVRDASGNKLVDYTPPTHVPGYTQIFRWKEDLDLEIWKALEVPPEIIQAQASGSGYSGRWIPFAIALSAVHLELAELIRCVDRDILRPIAHLNFGARQEYEIRPVPLVETYAAMFGSERSAPSRRKPQDDPSEQETRDEERRDPL